MAIIKVLMLDAKPLFDTWSCISSTFNHTDL